MYDSKKKELEKKDKVSDMITKDSVKKEDEKKEEEPDMRSKYAMINIIKNKLRAAGQRDPMVMAVDACEEKTPTSVTKSKKPSNPSPDDKGNEPDPSPDDKGNEPEKPDMGSKPSNPPKKPEKPIPPKPPAPPAPTR